MKGDGKIIVGVAVSAAAFAGLLWWGSRRASSAPAPTAPPLEPVGPFPSLRVGDLLLVDAQAAELPLPLRDGGQVVMIVDQVLSDPFMVSAKNADPRFLSVSFSGSIRRAAIVKVLASAPQVFT